MEAFTLKKDFSILKAETGKYMLYTPHKKYYIPELFYQIIALLQEGYTVEEIEAEFEGKIAKSEIEKIIEKSFSRMGILSGSNYDQTQKKRLLIWRKDIMEPTRLYNEHLVSLIFHKFFVIFFLISYLLIYTIGIYQWGAEVFGKSYFSLDNGIIAGVYLIIFYVSSFVHELGHYLSSMWLGAKPGKIGVGIYLVTPVLYATLDDIWRLSTKKRNIINIAGVYFQSVFLLFFAGAALILQQKIPFMICFLGSMGILVNLCPFLKFDGYWIVNDYLDTSELMHKSISYLNFVFRGRKNENTYSSDNKFKIKVFRIYSICFGLFILFYGIIFIKMFWTNAIVLYGIILRNNYNVNIFLLGLRSLFIVITSIKVVSIIRGSVKGRCNH